MTDTDTYEVVASAAITIEVDAPGRREAKELAWEELTDVDTGDLDTSVEIIRVYGGYDD